MSGLARLALRHKSLVLAIFLLALVWSLFSALTIERREDPLTTQRQTLVVTRLPGATTENVEQLITKKIVDDLRGIAHVSHVEGVSRPQISTVNVVFDDEITNADGVLRDVRNHLADLHPLLPPAAQGPGIVDDFWLTYPLIIGVTGDGYDRAGLRDLAKHIADELSRLPDVDLVKLAGAQERQIDVDADLLALSAYGLSAGEVIDSIAARNQLVPNGSMALAGHLTQIDANAALHDVNDVAAVGVRAPDGRVVRVGDIADVHTGYPDPPEEIVHVDGMRGVVLAVRVRDGVSVTDLGRSVEARLAELRPLLPVGVRLTLIADQPQMVHDHLADFLKNLVLGVVSVTALVALFMGLRNGVLVGVTILISVTLTVGAMPFLHINLNQMSMLALIISLGIVVDVGIVAVDNVEHHLREGHSRAEAAGRGVGELWFPLLTSTVVAMSSYIPFRLMGGSIGDFVRDLGIVTSLALCVSLLVVYFITPILCECFAVAAGTGESARVGWLRMTFDGILDALRNSYVPIARQALRRPRTVLVVLGVAFVASVLSIPRLGVQFFPSADRSQFFIDIEAPEGTDILRTEQLVARVEMLLKTHPEVTAWGAFIGRGAPRFYYNVIAEQPKPSYAQIIVDTTSVPSANALIPLLQREIDQATVGARFHVKKLEQGPPVGSPVQICLTGEDRNALALASTRIQALLRSLSVTVDVRDSLGVASTTLRARIDQASVARSGVSNATVADTLALAYGGREATQIRESDRQTPVIVRLPAALRNDPASLAALGVRIPGGASVPLGELARFVPSTQTSIATYRDGTPEVVVYADVQADTLASTVLSAFKERLRPELLPPGVHLSYAGEDEETSKAFGNLLIALFVGLMINQIVLIWEFRTLRLSLVVLSAVPLGLIGAVLGLALTGNHFGFVAFLGVASLGGIVTNHTIMLFEYAHREMGTGHAMHDALIIAGTKRLRPILLTVTASIAGLLPLAFSEQTLWRPMCWVVIFGLLASMAMTLVAIPAIYSIVGGEHRPRPIPTADERRMEIAS